MDTFKSILVGMVFAVVVAGFVVGIIKWGILLLAIAGIVGLGMLGVLSWMIGDIIRGSDWWDSMWSWLKSKWCPPHKE